MGFPQEISPAHVYMLAEWAIRICALIAIPFRRSPDTARAWLLLLLLLPVPGLLLYWLIGRPTYPRSRRKRLARAATQLQDASDEIAHSSACRRPELSDRFRPAALLIENIGRFPALGANAITLIADYDGAIDRLVSDIDSAEHHVHIQMYIFTSDETGKKVMGALDRAASRGIECRVLIDAIGSSQWSRRVTRRLLARQIKVARTLPVAPWRRGSARADLRNHRKIAVVDGVIGHVGSQNIVNAEATKGIVNEELVARVIGPAVVEMQTVFAIDWLLETDEALSGPEYFRHHGGPGDSTAQLMPSGPDYGEVGIGHLTVALIHGAIERVIITTPYFIPDAALLQALRTAVLRGVNVDLIVPSVGDNRLVRLAQQSYYSELLESGVNVRLYGRRFLHAKHVTIDNEIALIGSSNVDVRSFVLNAEVTLIVYDQAVVAELRAQQERWIIVAEHLTSKSWSDRSRIMKTGENFARLVSPLL
jgi:cardiolipin synthase